MRWQERQRCILYPGYAAVAAAAHVMAVESGRQHVGVDDLLLAIIRDRRAVPTQVLAELIDVDQAEVRLQAVMQPGDVFEDVVARTGLL